VDPEGGFTFNVKPGRKEPAGSAPAGSTNGS